MKVKTLYLFTALGLAALGATAAQAGTKVLICHVPPGNPDNFHTITVSENALPAHLGHGDLPGGCSGHCDAQGALRFGLSCTGFERLTVFRV